MANGRNGYKRGSRVDAGRDSGGFIALPWSVMDSPAYQTLSHPARSLLLEIARQYVRDNSGSGNNGRLLASRAYLAPRGWTSDDVRQRAKAELLAAGFIHETFKGHRPNRASWYAMTWRALDPHPGYDPGAAETFERGTYKKGLTKNASLIPSDGTESPAIVPSDGTEKARPVPSDGTIRASFGNSSVPSDGHHLEKPSTAADVPAVGVGMLTPSARPAVDGGEGHKPAGGPSVSEPSAWPADTAKPAEDGAVGAGAPAGKRGNAWTPERLAELRAYLDGHSLKETIDRFGVSRQRIYKLLDGKPRTQRQTWTPDALAELRAFREAHGLIATAAHYGCSKQLIVRMLPGGVGTAPRPGAENPATAHLEPLPGIPETDGTQGAKPQP